MCVLNDSMADAWLRCSITSFHGVIFKLCWISEELFLDYKTSVQISILEPLARSTVLTGTDWPDQVPLPCAPARHAQNCDGRDHVLTMMRVSSSLKGFLFPVILIVVAFFGLFFLPLCLLLYLLPFCGELARTANDLLISLWLKLVPVCHLLLWFLSCS